ncbi:STAS-like domain-containing protein [Stutzerimonas stutzeri]|uniref:STAS-like domain-containing protein n=1 Tax=Stutzerimonas stutzeri TaxID=316 RepID=UPI001C854652|nr:STAS-like domain-containing protein [Stutzerimonas stutzeri]
MNQIKIFELTGKNAISMQSGEKLYAALHNKLVVGDKIVVDFEGVALFASPFFNASIGLLLKDISIENLQRQLSIINLSDVGRDLLNHVISNALVFYKNVDKVSKAIDRNQVEGGDE